MVQSRPQHGATLYKSSNPARSEVKQTEDFLAAEMMSQLSVQERLKALDDMHCVGEGLKETPEMIKIGRSEFRKAEKRRRTLSMKWLVNKIYRLWKIP
ncbi:MAG: hypothetical protein SGBAC_013527, partial [Bacillariaceae sp.]